MKMQKKGKIMRLKKRCMRQINMCWIFVANIKCQLDGWKYFTFPNDQILPLWIHLERVKKDELAHHMQARFCLPCIASWDRSECRSPGSSGTAWGTVSAAAW